MVITDWPRVVVQSGLILGTLKVELVDSASGWMWDGVGWGERD